MAIARKDFERQVWNFQRNASITSPFIHRIMKLNGRAAGRQLSVFPPLGSSVSILLHLLGLFVLGKEQGVSAIHLPCYSDQNLPQLCLITFSLLHIAERDLAKEKVFSRWRTSCRQRSMLHVSINIRRLLLPWHAQKTGKMTVSQEGGPPAAFMFIYTVEFGVFFRAKDRLSSTSTYCPLSTCMVLGGRVTHRWLFSSFMLTSLLSGDKRHVQNNAADPLHIVLFSFFCLWRPVISWGSG